MKGRLPTRGLSSRPPVDYSTPLVAAGTRAVAVERTASPPGRTAADDVVAADDSGWPPPDAAVGSMPTGCSEYRPLSAGRSRWCGCNKRPVACCAAAATAVEALVGAEVFAYSAQKKKDTEAAVACCCGLVFALAPVVAWVALKQLLCLPVD